MDRINTNPIIREYPISRNSYFPGNKLPVLHYRNVFVVPRNKAKACEIIRNIFLRNKWKNTWTNGIYNFHHYHSNVHEALGIACGSANVVLGGIGGKRIRVQAGEVLILPAGVAHASFSGSDDFVCIGCYPVNTQYDIRYGKEEEWEAAIKKIRSLGIPRLDPVFGKEGFLRSLWNKQDV